MAKIIEDSFDEAREAREASQPKPLPVTAAATRAARSAELHDIIRDFRDEWGEAPTVDDLCRILGIERTQDMEDDLEVLEKRGVVRRTPVGPGRSS
jgi:SOS-response transcriptional repressor LexA